MQVGPLPATVFFQTAARAPGANSNHRAINVNSSNGGDFTVSGNTIGYANGAGTGNTTYQANLIHNYTGIYIASTSTPSVITGNTISGFRHTAIASGTFPGTFSAIAVISGQVNVTDNVVGSSSAANAILLSASGTANYRFTGIYVSATGTAAQIADNVIAGIGTATSATTAYSFYPIYTAGNVNFTISRNIIGSTTQANSIAVGSSGTTGLCSFYGIYNNASGIISITENTVQHVTVHGSGASFYNGIFNYAGSGVVTIAANTLSDATLFSSSTSSTSGMRGIYNEAAVQELRILNNTVKKFTAATNWYVTMIDNMGSISQNITIDGNQLGTALEPLVDYAVANPATLRLINNGAAGTEAVLNIRNNQMRGIQHSVTGSGSILFVGNSAVTLSQNISQNAFYNLNLNTSGSVTLFANNVALPAAGTQTISDNTLIGGLTKAPGGSVTVFTHTAASASTASIVNNNNTFTNINLSGATTLSGWQQADAGAGQKSVNGNLFTHWTSESGNILQPCRSRVSMPTHP